MVRILIATTLDFLPGKWQTIRALLLPAISALPQWSRPPVFPGGINPWYNDDGDTCGDLHETTPPPATDSVTWNVQNIKVLCQGTTSALSVPYVLSYAQTSTFQASCSALNVVNGAPSKCNSGTAEVNVGVVPLQVAGYVDVTKQTLPDGDGQSFSFTATGPVGSTLATSTDGGTTIVSAGSNTVTVNRTDGQTIRIYMSVISTNRTLTISEAATTNWETSASLSCAAVTGSPTLTTNNATRTVTAALNTTNSAAACTFTNSKKSRVTIAKSVGGRVNAADQFTVSASAGVGNTLTTDAGAPASSPVSVSTSGTGTSASTILRSTPGLALTITDAMAGGSVSTLAEYDTRLTCVNAFAGSGATPNGSLPSNSDVSTFNLTPAPDDDITCTYTNSPKPRISLQKAIAVAGGGRLAASDQFALTVGTASGTTTGTGSSVTSGAVSFVGTTGVAVSLSEAAAGTTNLANYDTSISCTNSNGASATVLPSGSGTSFNLTPAGNDVISCTLTNSLKADMVVDVSGLPTSATIGVAYSGSYSCTNAGGAIATAATCSVSGLPAGLTSTCVPVPPANIAIGASIVCTVSGVPTTTGSNNVMVTTSATNEGNTTNNVGNTTITVGRTTDLSIGKTDSPDPVIAGSVLTYTITVTNNGPSTINAADTFTVTDVLPSGLSSCSHTPSAGTYTVASGEWTGVSLANGGSVILTIACTVDANFAGTSLSNSVTVTPPTGTTDPLGGNNTAGPVITAVNREANLSVSKTDGVATVVAGGTTTYTIVVSNAGPSFANNSIVTDTPSAGLVLTGVSCASAGGASCPGVLTVADLTGAGLTIAILPPGGTVTLTVTANVTATGQ